MSQDETHSILKENYLSLDLEMAQPSKKIIQIGAVVGNIKSGAILEKLSVIVNPFEPLTEFIIKLTGITDERIAAEGVGLKEAYGRLALMHKRHDCFVNPITWGGGDSIEIREQLNVQWEDARIVQQAAMILQRRGFHARCKGNGQLAATEIMLEESKKMFSDCQEVSEGDTGSFAFGRRWIDAKTLYVSWCIENDIKPQGGLAKAMTKLGLKFDGRKHTADDDAYNTFLIYRRLLRYFKEKPLSKGAEDFAKSQVAGV